jgi:hypothetical protein
MIIEVHRDGTATFHEATDLKRLSITGRRPDATGTDRLAQAGVELTDDAAHGFVAPDTLKAWAAVSGSLSDTWYHDFDAMVAYATSKGWTDEGGRLRAHTEWTT